MEPENKQTERIITVTITVTNPSSPGQNLLRQIDSILDARNQYGYWRDPIGSGEHELHYNLIINDSSPLLILATLFSRIKAVAHILDPIVSAYDFELSIRQQ
jgi:hypothetical protein